MAPDKEAISEVELQGYWASSGGHQVSGRKAGPRGRVPTKKHKQQKMRPGKQFETAINPLNSNRPSGMDLWRRVQDKVQQESHRTAYSSAEQRTQSLGSKSWYSGNELSRVPTCGRTSHASMAQQAANAGTVSASVWVDAYDPSHAIVGGGFGDDVGQDLAAMEDQFRAMQAEGDDEDAESVASAARSGILGPSVWQSEEEVKAWASTAWPEWERIFRSKIRPQTRCFWPNVKESEDEQRKEWVLWATGICKRLKGWARGYLQIAEKVRLARHLAHPCLPAGCLVPGSTNAYVTVRGFTDKNRPTGASRVSADPSALQIMGDLDRLFGCPVVPRQACRLEGQPRNVTDDNADLLDVLVSAHTIMPVSVAEAWSQGTVRQLLKGEALRRYDETANSLKMSSGATHVTLTMEPRVTDEFAKAHMYVIRIVDKDNRANWSFNEALSIFLNFLFLAGLSEYEAQQLIRAQLRSQNVMVDAVSFRPKLRVATEGGPRVGRGCWYQTTEEALVTLSPHRVAEPSKSLKLFLGAQPTKCPEKNADNNVPPALVLPLKLEPVRPPSSQPGGNGAAQGDTLARAAVLFKLSSPITSSWALQGAGSRREYEIIPDEVVTQWNNIFGEVVCCDGISLAGRVQHDDPLWTGFRFPCSGGGYLRGDEVLLACKDTDAARALQEVYEQGVAQMVPTPSATGSFIGATPWSHGQAPPEWPQTRMSVVIAQVDPETYNIRSTEAVVRELKREMQVDYGLVLPEDPRGVSAAERKLIAYSLTEFWEQNVTEEEIRCAFCNTESIGVSLAPGGAALCHGCFGLVIGGIASLTPKSQAGDALGMASFVPLAWTQKCDQPGCVSANSMSVAGSGQGDARCGLCVSKEAHLVGPREWFNRLGYEDKTAVFGDPLVEVLVHMVFPVVALQFGCQATHDGSGWEIKRRDAGGEYALVDLQEEWDAGDVDDMVNRPDKSMCVLCGFFTISAADLVRKLCGSCRINEDLCLFCPAASTEGELTCKSHRGMRRCRFCEGKIGKGAAKIVCANCSLCVRANGCVGRQVRQTGQACQDGCRLMLDRNDATEDRDTFYLNGRCVEIGGTVRSCRICAAYFSFNQDGFYTDAGGYSYCAACQAANDTIPCDECGDTAAGRFDSAYDAFYCSPCHAAYQPVAAEGGGQGVGEGEVGVITDRVAVADDESEEGGQGSDTEGGAARSSQGEDMEEDDAEEAGAEQHDETKDAESSQGEAMEEDDDNGTTKEEARVEQQDTKEDVASDQSPFP